MSIWKQGRIPGQHLRHALGVYLTYRKLASSAYVPSQRARKCLMGTTDFDQVFTFVLTAQGTDMQRVSVINDFICTSMQAGPTTLDLDAPVPASYRVQVMDVKPKKAFSEMGVNDTNFGGIGAHPKLLRYPYRFKRGTEIQVRVQNMLATPQTVQVVLHGGADACGPGGV